MRSPQRLHAPCAPARFADGSDGELADPGERRRRLTTADLLVLVPWLIFGIGLVAIGFRLLGRRRAALRRHRGHR